MPRRPSADAIGTLYDRCGASLYRYALMILADPPAAADAVHDVFVAVLRRGVTLENAEHYLRRAVRNECYSVLRRRKTTAMPDGPLIEPLAREPDDPHLRNAIERALRELAAEARGGGHLKAIVGVR